MPTVKSVLQIISIPEGKHKNQKQKESNFDYYSLSNIKHSTTVITTTDFGIFSKDMSTSRKK